MSASKKQIGGNHYARFAIQPSEFTYRNGLGWCEGNAIKYICRHKFKAGKQDLEKAIHYLTLLLEWEYGDDEIPKQETKPSGLPAIWPYTTGHSDDSPMRPNAGQRRSYHLHGYRMDPYDDSREENP